MQLEKKDEYLKKLVELLKQCFEDVDQHAVLIVGNDRTRMVDLHAINADPSDVSALVAMAATYCVELSMQEHTVN